MKVVVKPKQNKITVLQQASSSVIVNSEITALSGMTDVEFVNLTENDVIKYSSGKWINTQNNTDSNFIHNQSVASATWEITHNLSKFPSFTIVDSSGDEVEGDITYMNNQQVVINFSAAFSGVAYLN